MIDKFIRILLTIFSILTTSNSISFAHDTSEGRILVQSTTSTQNSGLYDYLLPKFEEQTGLSVHVIAVGTGQAIKNAKNGDADVLLVHAKSTEETFVQDGYGVERFNLMYNDFVIIGPSNDPEELRSTNTLNEALDKITKGNSIFISRGDDSGTHKKELALWNMADIAPTVVTSKWYRETGSGMGSTIRVAIELNGYTITDRATWIAFEDKQNHAIIVEGYPELLNQYGLIKVNPQKHPHVNTKGADRFITWLLSPEGQKTIAAYKVDNQQLFFPNADTK